MALLSTVFAVYVTVGAAVGISGDYGDAPVRRMAKSVTEADEEAPVRRAAKLVAEADDDEGPVGRIAEIDAAADDEAPEKPDGLQEATEEAGTELADQMKQMKQFAAVTEADEEELMLPELVKAWPRCQALHDHNWHLRVMRQVANITSAQACAEACGGAHSCAGWAWVERTWATEFLGHKSCAMFTSEKRGKEWMSKSLYKNHCCIVGTPCYKEELLTEYNVSAEHAAEQNAAALRKARRRAARDRKMERQLAAHALKKQEARMKQQEEESTAQVWRIQAGLFMTAVVFGVGVVGGIYAWWTGCLKSWF